MVVFRLFEKLRYLNERSTKFESLNQGKMVALQISPKIESSDRPQNYKDLYGILQLLRGSHLNNFPLKTQTWLGSSSVSKNSVEMIRFSI